MSPYAPACVPIEITSANAGVLDRVFHLSAFIGVECVTLQTGLPEEPEWLRGPLQIGFHLPGAPSDKIVCTARAEELVDQRGTETEHASLRSLRLIALPQEASLRIESYVTERLENV